MIKCVCNQRFLKTLSIIIYNKQYTKLWTNLAVTIKNVYIQTCRFKLTQGETFMFTAEGGSTINVSTINSNKRIDALTQCIQNNKSVTQIKNLIIQNIV